LDKRRVNHAQKLIDNARAARVLDSSQDALLRGSANGLELGTRRMDAKQIKTSYERWSRRERSAILDELRALTGWSRRRRVESGRPIDSRAVRRSALIYEIDPGRKAVTHRLPSGAHPTV
jgi:hypothetical protein